ncbi:hypothetical protein [Neorhizobium sp. JUb45]|uniref:hypothetical protein n=1 Tax=Neorhizobium sp. JUb45 TaxID=2485113 RepID=UPI0010533F2F
MIDLSNILPAWAFSDGDQKVSMSSIGGRVSSRLPRNMPTKDICWHVASLCASASVSAAVMLIPMAAYGRSSWSEGWKAFR